MATRASGFMPVKHNWYIESRIDVDRFLDVERFTLPIWDPCCGQGNIPDACRARGMIASGSDIVDRGWKYEFLSDFLTLPEIAGPNDQCIIMNPPYDKSLQFTLKALRMVSGKVAVLEKTTWLEGKRRHKALWSLGHLVRFWQYSDRIRVPPGGIEMPGHQPSTAYAWFVFDPSHQGSYTGGWIS